MELRAEYSQLGVLYSVIDAHHATKISEEYGSDGGVCLTLSVMGREVSLVHFCNIAMYNTLVCMIRGIDVQRCPWANTLAEVSFAVSRILHQSQSNRVRFANR